MHIREFQHRIRDLYLNRDASRGMSNSFVWFVEEVGELARELRSGDVAHLQAEFADVAAWLFSLANLAGIDMETAVAKYADGCPRCGDIPCRCVHRADHGNL